ncbi:hypothetical protein [Arthrobacter sp. 92]|uniref:hypothetical protein n=1 Tax=Arthrobacter sp. 92 TaxID=3418175 RepID=UPI003CFF5C53
MSHSEVTQAPEEVIAYWTPQRMAEAQPREIRLPAPGPESSEPEVSVPPGSAEAESEAAPEQE